MSGNARIWRILSLVMAIICCGCGRIRVTSNPPGATLQRANAAVSGGTEIQKTTLQYCGETPTSFFRSYQVEAVRVIWDDDTASEWQMTKRDVIGANWARFHFEKHRPGKKGTE